MFRGSASVNTGRFSNKLKSLRKKIPNDPVFKKRLNIKSLKLNKKNWITMEEWIKYEITNILGFDDDVVVLFIINLLNETDKPDAREIIAKIMGFLESDSYVCSKNQIFRKY